MLKLFQQVAVFIKTQPQIWLWYLVAACLLPLAALDQTPLWLDIIFFLTYLTWFGFRFGLIRDYPRLKHKPLDIGRLFLTYAKAIIPVSLFLLSLTLLPVILVSLSFGRWYIANYLDTSVSVSNQYVLLAFVQALAQPELWAEFKSSSWFGLVLVSGFNLLSLIGYCLGLVGMVFWRRLNWKGFVQALAQAVNTFISQPLLLAAMIVGLVLINLVRQLATIFNPSIGLIYALLVSAFGQMIFDLSLFLYLKDRVNLWEKTKSALTWWYSRGKHG